MRSRKVAILESRLGKELAGLLERRGAVAVHAPALAELPDLDREAIRALVESLQSRPAKLHVFQTGAGTQALFAATDGLGLTQVFLTLLRESTVAVRGPKPAAALRARGVRIDRSAAEPYTTRELLACFADVPLEKARVIVQRHGGANIELDRALEARGALVAEVPTYRWSLPEDTRPLEKLIVALGRDEIDAVAFTNAEQARNLFAVAEKGKKGIALRDALNRTLVASIGPVASAALREAGVKVGVEAKPPKLGALLAALESALVGQAPG
ncbi:MAG TPA: uroporphyrinogen-III synthase [Burkholderiales bacterium]|nr:uroporphyrinogen-III synthase [Burkholderiales bacterium]